MKFAVAVSLLVASVQANAITRAGRQLADQVAGYWENEQYSDENFNEYVNNRMSTRSFTYTGCSRGLGSDKSIYVTFRLCDQCFPGSKNGCDTTNGEYVVSLDKFAEAYSKNMWLSNVDEEALMNYMEYYQEIYEQKMENYEEMREVNQLKYQNNYDDWLTYMKKQIQHQLLTSCQNRGECPDYENNNDYADQGQWQGDQQAQNQNAYWNYQNIDADPEKVVVDQYGKYHYVFSQDDFMGLAEQMSQNQYNEQWLQNYEIFVNYDQDKVYYQYLKSFWSYEYDANQIYELEQEYAQEQYEDQRENGQDNIDEMTWWEMLQELGDEGEDGNQMAYAQFACVAGETYREMVDGEGGENAYGGDGDYFIGPKCNGGSLELGLFYDEACTVESTHSVQEYLGFFPAQPTIEQCTSCLIDNEVYDPQAFAEMQGQQGNYGNIPLSPLCDEMLMDAGRCDRDGAVNTMMDKFWQDVVNFVNNGGQMGGQPQWDQDFDDYAVNQQQNMNEQDGQADYADQQQDMDEQDNQADYADQQQDMNEQDYQADYAYNQADDADDGGRRKLTGSMFYTNQATVVDTCYMIDNLPETTNALSRFAANSRQRVLHTLGWILFVIIAVALLVCGYKSCQKRQQTKAEAFLAEGGYKVAEAGNLA